MDEDEKPGALIATLGAASVAKVIYDLVANKDSNISSIFSMDKKGDLSLIGRLDWETRKSYTMYVRAESRTSPALVDTMQVDIEVRDVPDNPPVFECSPYTVTVVEDTEAGHKVIQLKCPNSSCPKCNHWLP